MGEALNFDTLASPKTTQISRFVCLRGITPPQFNVEPENGHLEKVQCAWIRGVQNVSCKRTVFCKRNAGLHHRLIDTVVTLCHPVACFGAAHREVHK